MPKSPLFLGLATVVLLVLGALAAQFVARPPANGGAAPAAVAPSAFAQSVPVQPGVNTSTGIAVTGEGRITVKPDLAQVTLGVEVTNQTAAGAQQAAASQMDTVVNQLKSQGIAEKDIQTSRYDLSPEYDYSNNRTPTLRDYRATNLVLVTVRDVAKVGPVLDAVASSGATRIQGISFSVSDPTAAGTQGRDEAMKDARAKADQLAKAAGVSVGAPISIEEVSSAPPVPVEVAPRVAAAPAAAPQTPISPGTQEVRTTVRVVYDIQ